MTTHESFTVEDLEGFFAELTDKPVVGHHRGVEFSTVRVQPHRQEDQSVRGRHLWVGFKRPLNLDLRLETREGVGFEFSSGEERGGAYRSSDRTTMREDLLRAFHWSATNTTLVLDLLMGRAGEMLLRLARSHHILMDDRGIRYGPIQGAPGAEAAALDALVGVLKYFVPPSALANQCPACGASVETDAATCPACGLSLE